MKCIKCGNYASEADDRLCPKCRYRLKHKVLSYQDRKNRHDLSGNNFREAKVRYVIDVNTGKKIF